jgi:phosphoglycerate dehydrogenase-like enzyme
LSAACPEYTYATASSAEQARGRHGKVDILIGLAPNLDESLIESLPDLKWVHALTTGVDNLLASSSLKPAVFISNSIGFHGAQMSELAILLMLSSLRDFPRMQQNQRQHTWQRWPQPLLQNKTACIVGLGSIAEALAERSHAFGMKLIGVSDGRKEVPGFLRVYPRRQLASAAGTADFLVVLVPYSQQTHHIINHDVMAAMRPDAILINLARGGCVDETALQEHLRTGSIRAAALDVFAREPLPENSPLWDTNGLTITPHIGGMSDIYREQVLPVVIDNLNAWHRGGGNALPGLVPREQAP